MDQPIKIVMLCVYSLADNDSSLPVNVSLPVKASTEPSLNDFQDFVVDMQKTITSLRKQVKINWSISGCFSFIEIQYCPPPPSLLTFIQSHCTHACVLSQPVSGEESDKRNELKLSVCGLHEPTVFTQNAVVLIISRHVKAPPAWHAQFKHAVVGLGYRVLHVRHERQKSVSARENLSWGFHSNSQNN